MECGTLPVPHRIKGKLWNADNLWSISLALGWPNMEFYLISRVLINLTTKTRISVYYIESGTVLKGLCPTSVQN